MSTVTDEETDRCPTTSGTTSTSHPHCSVRVRRPVRMGVSAQRILRHLPHVLEVVLPTVAGPLKFKKNNLLTSHEKDFRYTNLDSQTSDEKYNYGHWTV
jgi:hypothetical protein